MSKISSVGKKEGNVQEAIVVENLTFGYYPDSVVLEKISFSLAQGKFLGLIGPNGGGKTTLLKLLLGILSFHQGKITIFGFPPKSLKARQMVAYVPQHSNVPKDFPATVQDVILMAINGKPWAWRKKTAHLEKLSELAHFFQVDGLLNTPIAEISGGQMRRILLVRALLRDPSLLILDEPTAGVDSSGNSLFFEFIRQKLTAPSPPLSVIMSSHDVDILRAQADQIICLNRLVHFCDSANLVTAQLLKHTYQCELETFYHNREYHIFKTSEQPCREGSGIPEATREA